MKKLSSYLKKLTISVIVSLQMLTLVSCTGNIKEIQQIYLVVALGADLNSDGKYEITMQVLNPASLATQTNEGGSSGGGGNEILIYSGIGDTFFEALYEASKTMGKEHHFGHLKYIVLGEALALSDQKIIMDSMLRLEEIRLNIYILVTKGRAKDIVSARTNEGIIPANVVENLLERQFTVGYRPRTYLLDTINALGSKTTSPALSVIELVKPNDKLGSETFKVAGTAVLKKGRLIGYLNDKETRGLNFIKGKVEVGNITASCPSLGKISLEIKSCSSKIKPKLNEGSVSLEIKIKTTLILKGISTTIDPVKQNEIMGEIEMASSKAILEEVNLALFAARDILSADVFGFGEKVHAAYPKEWSAVEKDWDSIYQDMNIDVVVESKVRSTDSILKSVEPSP